jgi:hypothetical protein
MASRRITQVARSYRNNMDKIQVGLRGLAKAVANEGAGIAASPVVVNPL